MLKFDKLIRFKYSNIINELRKICDQSEVCVRNFKAFNIDIVSWGAILVPLSRKVPSEVRVISSGYFANDIWQLDDMLKIRKREVKAKEKASSEFETENFNRNYMSWAFLNTSISNHPASKCLKVTNMALYQKGLYQKRLFFICFNSNHSAKMSKLSYKGSTCNGKHNRKICTYKKWDDSVKTESQNDTEETRVF